MRYAFIKQHAKEHSLRRMCKVMQLHPGGYYARKAAPQSPRAKDDQRILRLLKQAWLESGGVYGYRKLTLDMRDLGERCGKHRVARLLKIEGLSMAELKRLPPDGQNLVMATSGTLVVAPWLYPNLPYDAVKDFTPIARAASFDFALTIGPAGPQREIKHVLAWMKANPDKANFATSGAGTLGPSQGCCSRRPLASIPRTFRTKGGAPAAQDLVAGLLPLMVDTAAETLERHKAGRVRIVAVTGQERLSALPEVPTLKEAGVNMTADGYFGLYGPAGMQPAVVQRIERAVAEALRSQHARDKISALGLVPDYLDSAGLKKLQAEQLKRWEQPVKASGFKPD